MLDHEAHNFTPWLADDLVMPSQALYLDELDLVSPEWKVDTFLRDIRARLGRRRGCAMHAHDRKASGCQA